MDRNRLRHTARLLLLLLLLPVSCTKETLHAVIVISTTGIDADVSSLQAAVSVAGVPATQVQDLLPGEAVFSLQLPDGISGGVHVDMTARSELGCTLASGRGDLQVSGPGRYDLTLPLVRLPAADCQTTVALQLTGVAAQVSRLTISAALDGKSLFSPKNYPGTTRELTLAIGDAVRGDFQVIVEGAGCHSCLVGRGTAMLSLSSYGRHVLPVTLVLLPQPQCPPLSGRLKQDRYAHTATLLDSGPYAGQVLILAGDANPPLTSAERYDPRSGTTSPAGGLLIARYGHTATLLTRGPDQGRILVTGGYNGKWLAEVEIYDPDTGLARTGASLRLPRLGHSATLLADGRVVVIGGHSDLAAYRSVEIYDPLTGQWSPADDAPTTEYQHSATLLADGRILVAGGLLQSSAVVASTALFDPSAPAGSQWVVADNLAAVRSSHTASLLPSGEVLLTGGYGAQVQTLSSAELFDPRTRMWRPVRGLSLPRSNHKDVLLSNNVLFLSGGSNYFLDQFLASGELYDPTGGPILPLTPLTLGRSIHTATLLPDDGVLLVGGLAYATTGGGTVRTDSIELVFPLACSL